VRFSELVISPPLRKALIRHSPADFSRLPADAKTLAFLDEGAEGFHLDIYRER
jgi:hypothetical protein